MAILRIDTADDPCLEVYTRLTEHQLRNKLDPKRAIVIAESRLVIETALERGLEPLSMLLDERHLESMQPLIEKLDPEVPIYLMQREAMSEVTGFTVTRGYLCAMRRPQPQALEEVLAEARRVAVLEGIVDTTNVGAIFRSAAALGLDAVLLAPACADPYSRRAMRVSMGSVLKLPWARFGGKWPHDAVELLHEKGFSCLALALEDHALKLDDPALKQHEKLALFLGTEGTGLKCETVAACDHSVIIPMAHEVDSLNVGAAAAVAFWELRV